MTEIGFYWEYQSMHAVLRMYKIKIGADVEYRGRMHWDPTNQVYDAYMPKDEWDALTQTRFSENSRGDIMEFYAFFGAIAPYYPRHFKFAGEGWKETYRMISKMAMQISSQKGDMKVRVEASMSLLDMENEPLPTNSTEEAAKVLETAPTRDTMTPGIQGEGQSDLVMGMDMMKLTGDKKPEGLFEPTRKETSDAQQQSRQEHTFIDNPKRYTEGTNQFFSTLQEDKKPAGLFDKPGGEMERQTKKEDDAQSWANLLEEENKEETRKKKEKVEETATESEYVGEEVDWGDDKEERMAEDQRDEPAQRGGQEDLQAMVVAALQQVKEEMQKAADKAMEMAAAKLQAQLQASQQAQEPRRSATSTGNTTNRMDMALDEICKEDGVQTTEDEAPRGALVLYDNTNALVYEQTYPDRTNSSRRWGNTGDTQMEVRPNPYTDIRERSGWENYAPGYVEPEEPVLRGDMPPKEYVRRLAVDGDGPTNNIMAVKWVADEDAFRNWMRTLRWSTPEYTIGYDKTYSVMMESLGVVVNWYRNNGCKSKEGWMPVPDAMKAVSEVKHVGALDLMASLKVISEAKSRSGQHWTFQVLWVKAQDETKWFYRHNQDYDRLKERVLVTKSKQEAWAEEKRAKWGNRNGPAPSCEERYGAPSSWNQGPAGQCATYGS